MAVKEVSKGIYYVGVNERTIHLFEGLWPLPLGVSLNAYMVVGSEKTALIDSVEWSDVECQLDNIAAVEGRSAEPDYLVVNHMEPDHSGGIPELCRRFPEMKVIGNNLTIQMLKGYYGIADDRFVQIGDGETISLGDKTLQFFKTPMVHWPETMMTWVAENSTLFTGDAFGCFGALEGGVVDTEFDTSRYIPEMYRYYSNIVGKYGTPVTNAIKKVGNLPFRFICPTHGPVWHDRIPEIVEIYSRLSSSQWEDGITIIYGSMYGHTAGMASKIADGLAEREIRTIRVHDASRSSMSDMISDAFRYRGLVVGSPTYSMNLFPPVEAFMKAMEVREVKGKVCGFFSNFTWASAALPLLEEYGGKLGWDVVATMNVKMRPDCGCNDTAGFIDALADRFRSEA